MEAVKVRVDLADFVKIKLQLAGTQKKEDNMKIILTIIMCLSFLAPVKAQETSLLNKVDTIIGEVDMTSILGNMRMAVFINPQKDVFYGAHIPVISYTSKAGAELVNLNFGFVYSSDKKKADIMTSLGFRLDVLLSKLSNNKNIRTAILPACEIGPFFSYSFDKRMAGVMAAYRFGGR